MNLWGITWNANLLARFVKIFNHIQFASTLKDFQYNFSA